MKKIVVLCVAAMTSSLTAKRITEEAKKEGLDYEAVAHSIKEDYMAEDADLILLTPQARFRLKNLKQMFPDKPIHVLEMVSFGRQDAGAMLKQAKDILEN